MASLSERHLVSTWVSGDRSGYPVRRRLRIAARPEGAGSRLEVMVEILRVGLTPFSSPRWEKGGQDREMEERIVQLLRESLDSGV